MDQASENKGWFCQSRFYILAKLLKYFTWPFGLEDFSKAKKNLFFPRMPNYVIKISILLDLKKYFKSSTWISSLDSFCKHRIDVLIALLGALTRCWSPSAEEQEIIFVLLRQFVLFRRGTRLHSALFIFEKISFKKIHQKCIQSELLTHQAIVLNG